MIFNREFIISFGGGINNFELFWLMKEFLLGYNSQTIKFTLLKCVILCFWYIHSVMLPSPSNSRTFSSPQNGIPYQLSAFTHTYFFNVSNVKDRISILMSENSGCVIIILME